MKKQRIISLLLTFAMVFSLLPANAMAVKVETFNDVSKDDWYYKYVDFVADNEYFVGTSNTTFSPEMSMTRAMFVVVMAAMEGVKVDNNVAPFADVPAGTWYTDAVIWARDNGITTGVTATEFAPGNPIAREQMVAFLARYYALQGVEITGGDLSGYRDADRINAYAEAAFGWAVQNGIVQGVTADTLVPHGTANRAQIATILMRCCLTFGK